MLSMKPRRALIWAAILLAPLAQAQAPQYAVDLCCDLCSRAADRSAYTTKFLQSFATLIQGRDGWLFRSEDDLRTTFGPDAGGYQGLRRLRAALKKRGVDLAMVYQPPRGLMHADKLPPSVRKQYNRQLARVSYTLTLQRFRDAGMVVPDFVPLINEKNEPDFFFHGDHHWTPQGARRTAHFTAEAIRALPSYQQMPRKKFVTSRTGLWAKRGTMQKAATQLCGFGYPDQYTDKFVTAAGSEGDLFADEDIPQITLVGTSNSDSAYNFAGFLSEELGVDILNESIPGGGYDGALLRYLPSGEFQKNTPKILIWELETYHKLSNQSFYRQVVPLVNNGCAGRRAVLSRQVPLQGATSEVLFNGGGRVLPLTGKHFLLDLQFSNPAVNEMKAVVWYTNGSKETISLRYSDHVEAGGRFVTELRADGEWGDRTFMSLDLVRPEGMPAGGSVKAQLCARADAPDSAQQLASAPVETKKDGAKKSAAPQPKASSSNERAKAKPDAGKPR